MKSKKPICFYRNCAGHKKAPLLYGLDRPQCLLFAEGDAEAYFLESWLIKKKKNPEDIGIICYEGQTRFGTVFRKMTEADNFKHVTRLGFFLDAEKEYAANKVSSIQNILVKLNILQPEEKLTAGKQHFSKSKSHCYHIALYISPDNTGSGCIEDIIMKEIRTDVLWDSINKFETSVNKKLKKLDKEVSKKSLVQAYIGVCKPGLCGTGRGFKSGALDVMHNAYDSVRKTLSPLFPL